MMIDWKRAAQIAGVKAEEYVNMLEHSPRGVDVLNKGEAFKFLRDSVFKAQCDRDGVHGYATHDGIFIETSEANEHMKRMRTAVNAVNLAAFEQARNEADED